MSKKEEYTDLFLYNIWANEAAYKSIIETKDIDEKTARLFSHIVASQKVWLSRIEYKGDNPVAPWHLYPFENLLVITRQVNNEWLNFIENSHEEKFNEEITYYTSQQKKMTNKVSDILLHVINHSTYHRAQIASLVRASGGIPAVTDYIEYKRR
jgi:uncharacterized damage-inducible protein DinB